jgi:hypothetical protein
MYTWLMVVTIIGSVAVVGATGAASRGDKRQGVALRAARPSPGGGPAWCRWKAGRP